jgi:polygalacturonase
LLGHSPLRARLTSTYTTTKFLLFPIQKASLSIRKLYLPEVFADQSHSLTASSDGFSSGGVTNGLYENNHIENGDDCMTVGNGANNIHFRNSYCKGGHGLSIGSLGKGGAIADVQNIL